MHKHGRNVVTSCCHYRYDDGLFQTDLKHTEWLLQLTLTQPEMFDLTQFVACFVYFYANTQESLEANW